MFEGFQGLPLINGALKRDLKGILKGDLNAGSIEGPSVLIAVIIEGFLGNLNGVLNVGPIQVP